MNKNLLSKILAVFIFLIVFIIGCLIGYFVRDNGVIEFDPNAQYEHREIGSYQFINPLLECEIAEGTIDAKKQNFEKDLENFAEKKVAENKLSKISVYFRDLNNGPAFGIHEEEPFLPASLLKVPMMMAYFSEAESNPDILKKEIFFGEKKDLSLIAPNIKPSQEIQIGNSYTVEQLIVSSIKYSDNQATLLLYENMPNDKIVNLFYLLGVDNSLLKNGANTLSATQYSRFFRILFNSSFLSRYYSEKALKLLSEVEYKGALVAGVPNGIVVSHKFGESGSLQSEVQLHDCGIVYYPNHPYLLCVMSKGKDFTNLENSIKEVSQFVYGKIAAQY